jgi:hypothetical protein
MFGIATEPAVKENIGAEIFRTPEDWATKAYSLGTHI